MEKYNPQVIEAKWQTHWEQQHCFQPDEGKPDKYYILVMFPYPSGRIHMGHVRNYAIGDVVARYQRLLGKNVLNPMGWDAFGMPAENAAIQQGVHPADWTYQNIATMRRELKTMGLSYDWRREFATCDPEYAHWEQLLFLKLYEKNLVYRKHAQVNWDPVDQTVLANEQVIDGRGWRSGAPVVRRELPQWFLRITTYADELLAFLPRLTGWPETVRIMQNNWIGKSHGLQFTFAVPGWEPGLEVFTTRADTLMGVTFCSIAPEHPLARFVAQNHPDAAAFIAHCQTAGTSEEAVEQLEKKGFLTGMVAIHPLTGASVPIYIANFVLMNYGTGAVMAVPAHDQRDFEFARRHDLPIRVVIQPDGPPLQPDTLTAAYTGPGHLVNSGEFDGLDNQTAKQRLALALTERGQGQTTTQYRLRDWGISRQRYWGNPIPMIHCPVCGVVPVPKEQLPVTLPRDVHFVGKGNPLTQHPTWSQAVHCPACGGEARRETDTMDTFMESSWYFLRYACTDCHDAPLDRSRVDYWLPVDQYVGGIEHAVLHLLYARFFHKALRDAGELAADEPFTRLLTQGMVRKDTHRCPQHGWRYPFEVVWRDQQGYCRECDAPVLVGRNEKMSKSKRNVVDPGELIKGYGADTARLFMLFAAPAEGDLEWNEAGVDGAWRFLNRIWRLVHQWQDAIAPIAPATAMPPQEEWQNLRRKIHQTIAKVTEDIERYQYNTAIAAIMELVNEGSRLESTDALPTTALAVAREWLETILILLHPFVPHLTEELWERLHPTRSAPLLSMAPGPGWPRVDPEALRVETITLVAQVNGKLRGRLPVAVNATPEEITQTASQDEKIKPYLEGRTMVQVILVPGRLINFVVK